jgi:activator of HSP90 ATPase
MTTTISQRVKFFASSVALFEMYLDSDKHAASTGVPTKLRRRVGGAWQAHGGAIGGKNLLIELGRRMVQAWRAGFWRKDELSALIMTFENALGRSRRDRSCRCSAARSEGRSQRLARFLFETLEEISGSAKEEIALRS